jgi:hypothetical protein
MAIITPTRIKHGWQVTQGDLTLDAEHPHFDRGAIRTALTVRNCTAIYYRDTANLTSARSRARIVQTLAKTDVHLTEEALIALSEAHIREYAALLQEGHQLGTIVVFQDGSDYYLADGFHRVAAAKSIDLEELPAEIRVGTKRDAMLYACGANKHGKPLSNPDKQRVVLHLLEDAEWGQWSDREIARHCGVSHVFVAKRRKALTGNVTSERTYRTKQGTVTTMNTRAIGKHAALDMSEDSTNTAEMAADTTVPEAVDQARPSHNMGLTTPDGADAVCDAVELHVTPVAPDNSIHHGHPKSAEAARTALPKRLSELLNLLEALATFPELEQLLLDILPDGYDRVDHYLDTAFETLSRLRTLWQKHRHEDVCHLQDTHTQLSLIPAVSAEPPQPRQPAQASRRGETGPAQPREESEDATQQTAKTGADYDTTRFYLGKPCPRAHTYRDTGQTLRRQRKGDCVQCHRAS